MVSPVDFLVNDARIRQPTSPGRLEPSASTIGTGLQVDDATLNEINNPLQLGTAQTVQELGQLEQFDFLLGQAETSLELTNNIVQDAARSGADDLAQAEQRFQQRVGETDNLNQEIAVAREGVDRITPDILGIFQSGLDSNVRGLTETRVENQIASENEAVLQSRVLRNQIQESAQQSLAGQANVDPSSPLFLY